MIGLELGSVWQRLGADVIAIEFLESIGGKCYVIPACLVYLVFFSRSQLLCQCHCNKYAHNRFCENVLFLFITNLLV